MTTLPITSLFVAFFIVFLVALSLPVIFRRVKVGAPLGDGGDETLRRRVRAQGNFSEYLPLGVIALGLVEAHGASAGVVVGLGGVLTATGRLRIGGMILTQVSLIGAAMCLISAF